jgi:hypothetical protein
MEPMGNQRADPYLNLFLILKTETLRIFVHYLSALIYASEKDLIRKFLSF